MHTHAHLRTRSLSICPSLPRSLFSRPLPSGSELDPYSAELCSHRSGRAQQAGGVTRRAPINGKSRVSTSHTHICAIWQQDARPRKQSWPRSNTRARSEHLRKAGTTTSIRRPMCKRDNEKIQRDMPRLYGGCRRHARKRIRAYTVSTVLYSSEGIAHHCTIASERSTRDARVARER